MNGIIQRKVAQSRSLAEGQGGRTAQGADPNWRLAFARAARDCTGLLVGVSSLTLQRQSLTELLELPPERALLAILDGPKAGLGLMMLSPQLMAALIEMQTTGRVSTNPALPRRPTRTDAAMVAGTIDRALQELEQLLDGQPDQLWTGGFRYASFLEDARPLGLLLEDHPYRVVSAELRFAEGARQGQLILALPAEGRFAPRLGLPAGPAPSGAAEPDLPLALADAVQSVTCLLQGVMGRVTLPLQQVMALQIGEVLALPEAALDRIQLETMDGRQLARARLGQNRGLRALRLEDAGAEKSAVPGQGDGVPMGSAAAVLGAAAMLAPDMSLPEPEDYGAGGAYDPPPYEAADLPALMGEDGFPGFSLALDADGGLLATG